GARATRLAVALALMSQSSQDRARVSGSEDVTGHIAGHDTAGANDRTIANAYARANYGSAAHPHVVAYVYGCARLYTAAPCRPVKWVCSGIDLYCRSKENVASSRVVWGRTSKMRAAAQGDDAVEQE